MSRSTQHRVVATVLIAVAAASLIAGSARAFNVGNGGTGTTGSEDASSFGDPDEQIGKMFGMSQGEESSSSLGSPAQFDHRVGKNPYEHLHFDTLTTPPDPQWAR